MELEEETGTFGTNRRFKKSLVEIERMKEMEKKRAMVIEMSNTITASDIRAIKESLQKIIAVSSEEIENMNSEYAHRREQQIKYAESAHGTIRSWANYALQKLEGK